MTAGQIIDASPAGATVTIQLDGRRNVIAWYVRLPDPPDRSLFGGSGRTRMRGTA